MNVSQAARGLADRRVLDYHGAGPTVLRMLVGMRLRRLREAKGISREQAGEAIRASHSKISRLEAGRSGFKARDIADLLTLYGVQDEGDRATLMAMAEQANVPGWWHAYSDVVPSWFEAYLGLEQAARVIRGYEVQFVPGLLQTEAYARAVISLGCSGDDEERIERRVELRMKRQRILHRPEPAQLWVVVDEAALRRPIGGNAVMRAQLNHLIDMCALPNVTIQVIPFSVGGHAAAGGPISILRLAERELPDVVYLEQLDSALYPDRPADIDHYRHIMNRLSIQAELASKTPDILRRILRDS